MTPEKAQEAIDSYMRLLELTAKQNLESLQDIDNDIRARKDLSDNQRLALLDYSNIQYKIAASDLKPTSNQPPYGEAVSPSRHSLSPDFSTCSWCGRNVNECHCGMHL